MDQTRPSATSSWNGTEILLREEQVQRTWWWFRLTTPADAGSSTYAKRERSRSARLLSTIAFALCIVDLILIPATLFIPNHYVIFLCGFVLLFCLIASACNRAGRILTGSLLLVSTLELALIAIIASTIPFDTVNLPLFDLLLMSVLFAASLLPAPYIFVMALFNSLFIAGELILQRSSTGFATAQLQSYLYGQFYAALARPVALQIIVGVVIFLWVRSTTQAIRRADRAEMIAELEHALVKQKEQLETDIQELLRTHTEVSNGNLNARTPMTQDKVLWPLAKALNILLTRYQRATKAEQELQRVQMLVPSLVQALQTAELTRTPLPVFQRTSTPIDPLLAPLSGKILRTPSLEESQRRH